METNARSSLVSTVPGASYIFSTLGHAISMVVLSELETSEITLDSPTLTRCHDFRGAALDFAPIHGKLFFDWQRQTIYITILASLYLFWNVVGAISEILFPFFVITTWRPFTRSPHASGFHEPCPSFISKIHT